MSVNKSSLWQIGIAIVVAGAMSLSWAQSNDQISSHMGQVAMSGDMKCGGAHMEMMKKPDYVVSMQSYNIPDIELLDRAGKSVLLQALLDSNQPVAVNFIFTTCTTICPIMSATFAQMRKALGPEADRIQLISITIDPEHDTPAVLTEYAKRYHAASGWRFLTGKPKDIEQVLRTFDVWTGTKTNHRPITLMHRKGDKKWVRVDGLASGTALAKQARTVLQ